MLRSAVITAILLLTTIPKSHTQNEYGNDIENRLTRKNDKLDDPHLFPRTARKLMEDYSEYRDYDSSARQEPSNYQQDGGNQDPSEQVVHSVRRSKDEKQFVDSLHVVDSWPDGSKRLGQLSAVSLDVAGNVVVFHRGDRVWNAQTFLANNIYNQRSLGPIPQNTIVTFEVVTGKVLSESGSHMFYMPHGLTVDHDNNIWVTDVALHQVFKFAAGSGHDSKPVMTLGVPFVPGNDDKHFCKPTDVGIMRNGDFFVSDGYCNTRIIKYSKKGKHLMQWGRSTFRSGITGKVPLPYEFMIPHALAVAEDKNMVCAADRENGRVQCFNCHNGTFIMQLHSPKFGPRVFSVAYSPVQGGLLYIVNGPDFNGITIKGFVVSLATNEIIEEFAPSEKGFSNPHDVVASPDGNDVYVVELNPYKVWKFQRGNANVTSPVKLKSTSTRSPDAEKIIPDEKSLQVSSLNISKVLIQPLRRPPQPQTSIPTVVGIILAVIVIAGIVLAAAIIRMRKRGYLTNYSGRSKRWEFPKSPVEGFKLGQFLDRHQGFEKVNTEESDDDGSNSSSEITTPHPQFA